MDPKDAPIVLDTESYPNYWMIGFKNPINQKVLKIELRGADTSLTDGQRRKIQSVLYTRETFGFNSGNYDLPVIALALTGRTVAELKAFSDKIITEGLYQWQSLQMYDLSIPTRIKHYDLCQPAPGVMVSLKLYGARMHFSKLQDLPYPPDEMLTSKQMDVISDYCVNDLDTTIGLGDKLEGDMALRRFMTEHYQVNLMSKGGAQIAEALVQQALRARSNKQPPPETAAYTAPRWIQFKSLELRRMVTLLSDHQFTVSQTGYVKLPPEVSKAFVIGNTTYKLGIGGLHSQEKNQVVKNVIDSDVVSYYPSIIINNNIRPVQLGDKFLPFYKSLFAKRVAAKHAGDMMASESYKLQLNSCFGKLSNRWSCLYDPSALLNVTLTGQLALLMLIEELELSGCSVYSANTDGIVHAPGGEEVLSDWEQLTGFKLEHANYQALYSRDINNYFAIKEDGDIKTKGAFSSGSLTKNPSRDIVWRAVIEYFKAGRPVEGTILNCDDIQEFLTVRSVRGGGEWRGGYLGKVVRFYWSKDGATINYVSNGNKVPLSDSSTPCMDLPDTLPADVDYDRYILEATDIVEALNKGSIK
jgi:hypothetical protein